MSLKELRKKLDFRLKPRENKEYLHWLACYGDRKLDGHHIIGKRNDLLVAKIDHNEHMSRPNENFDEHLIDAIENLCDYIEFLQNKI